MHPFPEVILLYGEVGAGKTTLISNLLKTLGSKDTVSSPTFTIVNSYQTAAHTFFHCDLYRIQDVEELLEIGFQDYFEIPNSTIIMEWPELGLPFLKDKNVLKIEIVHQGDKREYILKEHK